MAFRSGRTGDARTEEEAHWHPGWQLTLPVGCTRDARHHSELTAPGCADSVEATLTLVPMFEAHAK
jgi:hypothetical protein